ncbi:MAG: VTT domain-containing protein [Acidobacteriaceae bacterium]|nr:VTT domain-containing protein [Acidobacteriaceae bacterium]
MAGSSQLTYTGVLLAVFAQQLCLPIPSVVFLIAAGALSAKGGMQTGIVVLVAVSACLAADGLWFSFGRRWGSQVVGRLCRFSGDPRGCAKNAHEKFRHYGPRVLCVAKFVPGLDIVMPPLVGAEGVSPAGFLAFDAIGGLLWSSFYVALGYIFSNQIDVAISWVEHLGAALGAVIAVPICLYAGWRGLTLVRMIHRLRLRRISPAMLNRKLKSNRKVAVLDLLNFEGEADSESVQGIPGAMRIDPSRLRNFPHITVPDDVDMILYSSSGGDMVSARAALALNRIGVHKVWMLEGGLNAWRAQGLPVSRPLEEPDAIAERVGIKLPEPAVVRIENKIGE